MSMYKLKQAEPADAAVRRWLAVVILGIATFTIVATEFAPIGLLSSIASDLERSPATIGLTVTAYALIGAGSALLSAVLPNHFPRKPLLIGLMLVLAASNGLAMIAQTFPTLMLARIVGALSHGVFWAMVAAIASQIAPPNRMGLATTIVFGGISIANVLGVPVLNLIGQTWGWRVAFGALGGLCLFTALLMGALLPKVKAEGTVGFAALAGVLRSRKLWRVYAVAIFTVAAHFGAFTFIEPYLRNVPGVVPAAIAALLFGFGAAGLLGNIVTGFLIDRYMKRVIVVSLLLMCVSLAGLGWFGLSLGLGLVVTLLIVWGAAISILFIGIQTWVLRVGGAAAIPASAVYTTVFNSSSGVGAVLGAIILNRAGLSGIMTWAGLIVAVAIFIVVLDRRLDKTS
ncbi:MFS transporter [Paenibacillus tyrfis]|uniref:MFS transporter n=1 Tax=Paenibacillus tyrfis TaxID=1501230 RepID=UPI002491F51D|nr:MFS transporter [Paenibacillus tyrfis]GLI07945.1 MFS transporter [Paenibacillus tyrfis]